ncbi:MAG: hypothetical protein P8Y45_24490, partial [Exilibacterium sp.]
SAFSAYSTTLSGIEFEALLYPAHTSNLDILSAARPQLESWVQDHLTLVQDSGLKYPFKTFTLVEVPNALRGYGGGWRQDTTMAPPSMLLLRESGFPTARFDFYIGKSWPTNRQGTLNEEQANKLRDRVVGFFNGDLSGGDVFAGIARSYFKHQTAVSGEDAIALDFALQELTTLVLSGKRGYFSAYRFLPQYQSAFLSFAGNMFTQADGNVSGVAIDTFVDRPEVWEAIMSTPLHSVALAENSQRSIDQLYLKAGELAQMIYDSLGPRDAGKFLAQILRRHHAGTFTLDDVIAAGNQVSKQLGPVIAAWFEDTGLPGFVVDKASFYELAQTTSGDRQYQLLVTLRNDESTPGFARVSWTLGNEEDSNRYRSKPLHIGA